MSRDRQLANIDVQQAKRKWHEDLPLSLKEMAVALEIGYDTVLTWRRQPGFPYAFGKVFPTDFGQWRRELLGIQGPRIEAPPQNPEVNKSGATYALPRKAARILALAGL